MLSERIVTLTAGDWTTKSTATKKHFHGKTGRHFHTWRVTRQQDAIKGPNRLKNP
jgi:hypothetical protein